MSDRQQPPTNIDKVLEEFKKETVKYGPMTIRVVKVGSAVGWHIFLKIIEELSKTDALLKEQLDLLLMGGRLNVDTSKFINTLLKGAAAIPLDEKTNIQYSLFDPIKIKFKPDGMEADYPNVTEQFFKSVDPFFVGELFGRCLVVNFFESWSALQLRLKSWTTTE